MPENKKVFDQIKYQNNFIQEKYDRIYLTVPKGQKEIIKQKATEIGLSVNEYIRQAIQRENEKHK